MNRDLDNKKRDGTHEINEYYDAYRRDKVKSALTAFSSFLFIDAISASRLYSGENELFLKLASFVKETSTIVGLAMVSSFLWTCYESLAMQRGERKRKEMLLWYECDKKISGEASATYAAREAIRGKEEVSRIKIT